MPRTHSKEMAGLGFERRQSSSRTLTLNYYAVLSAHLSPPLLFRLIYPNSDGNSTTPCMAEGQSESLLINPGATRPRLSGPPVQNLRYSALSVAGPYIIFFVVDLVLFCFVFPFTAFPGRLSKATFCLQGRPKGQGLSGRLGFPKPQLPPGWGSGRLCIIYLFIYFLSRSAQVHTPQAVAPHWGKMKNGFRQWKTRSATWPPRFNFL